VTDLQAAPLSAAELTAPAPTRRVLVVVNPSASSVSPALRRLVVAALRARYEVEAVDTEARGHATELARAAAGQGVALVVAFGGDGTVNEAANGVAGTGTALAVLPGGANNVFARMVGMPPRLVDAADHLLRLADRFAPTPLDLAVAAGRGFCFSAGVGLDAAVVARVDARPALKVRLRHWYFAWHTAVVLAGYWGARRAPRLRVELPGGRALAGVTAVVQNGDPYSYFGARPIRAAEHARLRSGELAGAVLRRARPLDVPGVAWRALSRRAALGDHPQVEAFAAPAFTVRTEDPRPLPLQVDGDHVADLPEVPFSVRPGAVRLLA
jgi:diacylglycerol kinase family enzyme